MKTCFSSLQPLFKIISDEMVYKVQIITIEPLPLLIEILKSQNVDFVLTASSTKDYDPKITNVILKDSKIDRLQPGRYILFSNSRDNQFVQIVFRPTEDEKLKYLKGFGEDAIRSIDLYGRYKNIGDCVRLLKNSQTMVPLPIINSYEAILMSCCREKYFDKIAILAENLDSAFKNKFFVLMTLNGLVDRGLLKRRNNLFIVAIRDDVLKTICDKLGHSALCQ